MFSRGLEWMKEYSLSKQLEHIQSFRQIKNKIKTEKGITQIEISAQLISFSMITGHAAFWLT